MERSLDCTKSAVSILNKILLRHTSAAHYPMQYVIKIHIIIGLFKIKTAELAQSRIVPRSFSSWEGGVCQSGDTSILSPRWLVTQIQFIGRWNSDYINTTTYFRSYIYCQFKYQEGIITLGTLWGWVWASNVEQCSTSWLAYETLWHSIRGQTLMQVTHEKLYECFFFYSLLETVTINSVINGVLNSVTCHTRLYVYTNSQQLYTHSYFQYSTDSRHNNMWLTWRSPILHNNTINAGHIFVVHKLKAFVYTLILSVQVLVP